MKIFNCNICNILIRYCLGFLFVFSGLYKIQRPYEFYLIIREYQLSSDVLSFFVSVVLPWIELFCGFLLILNIYSQSSALIIMFLALIFIYSKTNNIIRGLMHNCGCFDFINIANHEKDVVGWYGVIIDIFIFFVCIPILIFKEKKV
jgi:putative oxidoreductase